MSKGSGRRKENTALVEANWPFPEWKPAGVTLRRLTDDDFALPADRKADQAYVEQTRQDNLAAANRDTEQDAKDG